MTSPVTVCHRHVTALCSTCVMTSSHVAQWLRAVILYYVQLLIAADTGLLSTSDAAECPHTCFCNPLSRIVYCSRRGLDSIPSTLPRLTLQLNVNGNHFRSRVLRRANFSASHASNIEHLYLSGCGVERLEVRVITIHNMYLTNKCGLNGRHDMRLSVKLLASYF